MANVNRASVLSMILFSQLHSPQIKQQKAGASLQEVITQALDAARSGVEATKNMIPVFGKAAVHAAQCEGVEDQGAVAGYYKILGLHNYICK